MCVMNTCEALVDFQQKDSSWFSEHVKKEKHFFVMYIDIYSTIQVFVKKT